MFHSKSYDGCFILNIVRLTEAPTNRYFYKNAECHNKQTKTDTDKKISPLYKMGNKKKRGEKNRFARRHGAIKMNEIIF